MEKTADILFVSEDKDKDIQEIMSPWFPDSYNIMTFSLTDKKV